MRADGATDGRRGSGDAASPAMDDAGAPRVVTVPNVITVLRMAATVLLLFLAHAGRGPLFLAVLIACIASDWIDGKLAILLDQRTAIGSRLDSVADVLLYTALVPCAWWLRPEFIGSETWLLAATGLSYALTAVTGLARFRRVPAYHTRGAKVCWFLIAVGVIFLFAGGSFWPARIAMVAVVLTNLEATAISLTLRRPAFDVPSIRDALRRRREHAR